MVVHSAPAPAQPPVRLDGSVSRARACRARRDLAHGDPLLRAAELLLAAPAAGFNIDLLTRRTGFSGPFVAACARRLYDNGVWRDGRAHYAAEGPEDARFWDDAAVALGTLCRRSGPAGHEWAAPGTWSKPYDYVGAPCGDGLAIAYQDASAPPPPDEPWLAPVPGLEREVACEPALLEAAAVVPARVAPPPRLQTGAAGGGPARRPGVVWLGRDTCVAGAPGRDLFPGATWLG
ncbi:MAG: hypothetical protein ACJ8J0_03205 [Longimicrobiaceae bacterium]